MVKLKVGGGTGVLGLTDGRCLLDPVSPVGRGDGLGRCTVPRS